jgi:hypothetical protein
MKNEAKAEEEVPIQRKKFAEKKEAALQKEKER